MEELRAVVRDHPDLVDAYLALAALENDFGSPAEAERLLLRARDLDPFHVLVRHQLVAALRKQPGRQADVRAALAELEEVQRLVTRFGTIVRQDLVERPNDPAVLTEYGGLLLRAKKEEMGRYWLQQALAVDPAYRPAHQALYDHYTAAGDTARAAVHKPFLVPGGRVDGP
jgi:tetratricopeptide (TPR) repeat protein